MNTVADILAGAIIRDRRPGETIAETAARTLFQFSPEHIDAAIAEAERRERWRQDR